MKSFLIIASLLFNFTGLDFFVANAHKFYVSTTTIQYNSEAKTLELTLQVFIDDVEQLLRTRYAKSINLAPDSNSVLIDSNWENYLRQTLFISTDLDTLNYQFLGKEYRNDLMFCYIEVPLVSPPKTLTVKNIIFFKLFDTQKNIVHFQSEIGRKSFLLDINTPYKKVYLEER